MPSPLVKTTFQACILAAISNISAQLITAHRAGAQYTINWVPVLQFMLFTALNTPPNFLWQSFLESAFPSHYLTPSPSAIKAASTSNENALDTQEKSHTLLESKLSIPNTLIKFFLDQTLGASINTLLFSLAIAGFKGATTEQAIWAAREDFWGIMKAGWRLWPLVCAINYTTVKSIEGRQLMGSIAGVGWGIYLSLVSN